MISILFLFFAIKTKSETLLNFESHINRKKSYNNIENSSPVSTTVSSSQWFIGGKTAVKKWVLMKTFKNKEWKLNSDNKQKRRRNYSAK